MICCHLAKIEQTYSDRPRAGLIVVDHECSECAESKGQVHVDGSQDVWGCSLALSLFRSGRSCGRKKKDCFTVYVNMS